MKIEEIEKLNAERTQGEWILLNPWSTIDGRYVVRDRDMDIFAARIDSIDGEGSVSAKNDAQFIAAAPTITEQYIRARRFEVTEEFIEKVMGKMPPPGQYGNILLFNTIITTLWEIVEGEDGKTS